MRFDYSVLTGRIVEKFGSRQAFAYAIGLSERSLSLKLNNKVGWKDREISRAIDLLELEESEIPVYFFKREVQNN